MGFVSKWEDESERLNAERDNLNDWASQISKSMTDNDLSLIRETVKSHLEASKKFHEALLAIITDPDNNVPIKLDEAQRVISNQESLATEYLSRIDELQKENKALNKGFQSIKESHEKLQSQKNECDIELKEYRQLKIKYAMLTNQLQSKNNDIKELQKMRLELEQLREYKSMYLEKIHGF